MFKRLEEAIKERLDTMASFVVSFHMTPKDYYELTVEEHEAIVRAWNKANRKRK